MKTSTNFKKESRKVRSPYNLTFKGLILGGLMLTCLHSPLLAQGDKYTRPSFWLGGAAGANFNFYQGTTQQLNNDLTVPTAFRHGSGVGLYLAPLLEYHRPDTRLGFMLQAGYDNRKGKFNQVITPCNCPADLAANVSYLTIEPSLRLAPFKSDLYFYAGPRIALNMESSFTYQQGINPAFPDQIAEPDVTGDFSHVEKTIFSLQIGAGYDIALSSQDKRSQTVLSPFISFQPYLGQYPRNVESWNMTTVRIGAALKFGKGRKIASPAHAESFPAIVMVKDPEVNFSVNSPLNIPVERRVRETFPLRNYVFFDLRSTDIPDRYVLLTKDQVKDFKEDQLEVFTPKRHSGRSDRQMIAYYNILNILGDRMQKNPSSSVNLSGSSMQGIADGKAMAESVKIYLVNIFGVKESRISTEGRIKPLIPSEQPGGTLELDMLRQCDRRVTIASNDPEIIMEFQSGPDSPLKPVIISAIQEAPVDSYVTFTADGAKEAFKSWNLEIRDEKGIKQSFGPYTQEKVSIPGKSILGSRKEGNFNVVMVGTLRSGKKIEKATPVHMVLWTPPANEEGMRFSVIFEFNQSDAITLYEKYLTEVVTPKIQAGSTVLIHGHSDIIGNDINNQSLSSDRASEVKSILERSLANAGKSNVIFEVNGFGEDENLSPFDNKLPEERFYNRTVIIDIIPEK